MQEKEIWRPVVGFEGYYEVSNYGSVRSIARTVECYNHRSKSYIQQRVQGKNLKSGSDRFGYKLVVLSKRGVRETFRVHRLVAEAFVSNPDNKPCVDHINTLPYDNRSENLRWVDYVDNANNILTLLHNSDYNSQFRSGTNANTRATERKKRGIGVEKYDAKICLTDKAKDGAFVRISMPNGKKVCDFGVSYDSLVLLKDEIEQYLQEIKKTSIFM